MASPIYSLKAGETAAASGTAQSTAKTAADNGLGKEAFLQLLVAQLKNQDPMSPADGIQFVTQLAQFSQLEQTLAIRQDADTLVNHLTAPASGN